VDPEYDLYLILASDGVWEFISPAQAVDIVHGAIEDGGAPSDACRTACRQLIAHAALEWRTQEGDYRDDISATVLWLPDMVRFLQSRTPDVAPAAA
jgi:serine/threonine protein phosphatase PrpC